MIFISGKNYNSSSYMHEMFMEINKSNITQTLDKWVFGMLLPPILIHF